MAITWLSTKGGIPLPGFSLIGTDKLAHASAYALLTFLLLRAFSVHGANLQRQGIVWLFAAGYGATMEFVQATWFPNRFFEYDDMLANAIGAGLALLVWRWTKR